ncbi:hypothetical protein BGX27_010085 [Mortierella sp. AM989]|nr:hypothetical protein BGX27_010085 [Mortierella sp. AM989]
MKLKLQKNTPGDKESNVGSRLLGDKDGNNSRIDHKRPTSLDIPLTMTFTPSSPCEPSGNLPKSFPPAEELIDADQLHPYSTPISATTPPYTFNKINTHNVDNTTSHPKHPTPESGLPSSTMIEIERILKQDEAIERDFTPPRQAMNSDESDFDWDEDVNIDDNGQVHKKRKNHKRSTWRKLSPFLRMIILMITVAPIVATPAILTRTFMKVVPRPDYPPTGATEADMFQYNRDIAVYEQEKVRKDSIVLVFTWIAIMWCVICVTNWGVDIIPVVIVRLTSLFNSNRLETVKSRLLIFVATKKYLKWLLASCWATGSFAYLSTDIHPIIKDQPWQPILIKILAAFIAGCALVLVEKILLQMISKNFHQTAYADRIKENKYSLQVLDRLGKAKRLNKKFRPTHSRNSTADNPDYMSPFGAGYRSRQHSRSESLDKAEMIQLTEPGSNISTPLSTPTENNSRNSTTISSSRRTQRDSKAKSSDIFKGINRTLHGIAMADSAPAKDINSTYNAKRLARTLFYNLQGNGEELIVDDFHPYFETEADAKEAFAIFDKDGNGDISKREIKEKIFYIYKERKDLHTSLRDLSQAVGKLDIIFLTIVTVVWLLIILSIFGTSVVQNMLSIGSFLVALSFVFGNSLKTLFENIVFLFITHPYDSGDLCTIDGSEMFVREVGLNSTMFVTWDGKRMYYPNNILSQKPIHNVRRSPNMSEKIVLNIDCYTSQAKILELRARMRDFLAKENKEFLPDLEIQIQEMDVKLKISMVIEHKGNWQDTARRWTRRTKFNFALKEAVEEIGIKYYALPQRLEISRKHLEDLDHDHSDQATLGSPSPLRHHS